MNYRKPLTLLLITTLTLVQTPLRAEDPPESEEKSPESYDLQHDQTVTRAEGLLWGALLGGILGAITGDEKKDKIEKAGLGIVVGAIAGFLLSNEVAKRKQQYVNREEALQQEVARLNQLINNGQNLNQQLTQEFKDYDQKIAQLQQELTEKNAQALDLQRQKRQLKNHYREAQKTLKTIEEELSISQQLYQEYLQEKATAKMAQWQEKISQLEQEKQTLTANINKAATLTTDESQQ